MIMAISHWLELRKGNKKQNEKWCHVDDNDNVVEIEIIIAQMMILMIVIIWKWY